MGCYAEGFSVACHLVDVAERGARLPRSAARYCSEPYVDSNQSLTFTPTLTSQGSCSSLPREAVGAVTGVDPITLCCSGVL